MSIIKIGKEMVFKLEMGAATTDISIWLDTQIQNPDSISVDYLNKVLSEYDNALELEYCTDHYDNGEGGCGWIL